MKTSESRSTALRSRLDPKPQIKDAPERAGDSVNASESSIGNLLNLLADTPAFKQAEFQITQDVVKQASKGALGELLAFLGERMVGRMEVKRAREKIHHQSCMDGGECHPKLVELEKAKRRMRAARVAVDVARKGRGEAWGRLKKLQMEKAELEEKVRRGRELGMLLGFLEERERVRMRRMEEVKRMAYELRKRVEDAKAVGEFSVPQLNINYTQLKPLQWRPRYTKGTVAKLHVYHVRLKSGRFAEAQKETVNLAEERLRNVMRSSLEREIMDDELRKLLGMCREAADVNPGQNKRADTEPTHIPEDLQRSADEVRIKEAKITALNDEIAAKIFVAGQNLQRLQVFKQSAGMIRKTLSKADDDARGYVGSAKDALTRDYANWRAEAAEYVSESDSFAPEQLRRGLDRCQAMEAFVTKLSALKQGDKDSRECLPLISPIDRAALEERYGKTLERKLAKAKAGLEIGREVEVLVEEARALTM